MIWRKNMDKYNVVLTPEEKQIEEDFANNKYVSVDDFADRKKRLESVAKATRVRRSYRTRKTIKVDPIEYERFAIRASNNGLSDNDLLNMVIKKINREEINLKI